MPLAYAMHPVPFHRRRPPSIIPSTDNVRTFRGNLFDMWQNQWLVRWKWSDGSDYDVEISLGTSSTLFFYYNRGWCSAQNTFSDNFSSKGLFQNAQEVDLLGLFNEIFILPSGKTSFSNIPESCRWLPAMPLKILWRHNNEITPPTDSLKVNRCLHVRRIYYNWLQQYPNEVESRHLNIYTPVKKIGLFYSDNISKVSKIVHRWRGVVGGLNWLDWLVDLTDFRNRSKASPHEGRDRHLPTHATHDAPFYKFIEWPM